MCASTTSPVGARTTIEYELFVALANSTQASTRALAVAELICVFISVRFATSSDTITLDSGAGVVPCACANDAISENVIVPNTRRRFIPEPPSPWTHVEWPTESSDTFHIDRCGRSSPTGSLPLSDAD